MVDDEKRDWRTFNVCDQAGQRCIDRIIAQRSGWHLVSTPYPYSGEEERSGVYSNMKHVLTDPKGVARAFCVRDDPWDWLLMYVPHYTTDLNAALELMSGNRKFNLEWSGWNGGAWAVESGATTLGHEQSTVYIGSNAARQICIAWLELQDQIAAAHS